MFKKLFFVALIGTILGTRGSSAQVFAVIVNKNNPVNELTKEEVSKLFLKKTTQWSNGESVLPVDLSALSDTRKAFSVTVLSKTAFAVKSYWQQQAFSRRGIPPEQKDNEKAVLKYVQEHPGAIGYISPSVNYTSYYVKIVDVN